MKNRKRDLKDFIHNYVDHKDEFDLSIENGYLFHKKISNSDFHNFLSFPKSKHGDIYLFTDGGTRNSIEKQEVFEKSKYHRKGKEISVVNKKEIDIETNYSSFSFYIERDENKVFSSYSIKHTDFSNKTYMLELKGIYEALKFISDEDVMSKKHNEGKQKNKKILNKDKNIYLCSDSLSGMSMIRKAYLHFNSKDFSLRKRSRDLLDDEFNQLQEEKPEVYQLLKDIVSLTKKYQVNLSWNRGHVNFIQNEIADSLATKGIEAIKRNHFQNTMRMDDLESPHALNAINSQHSITIIKPNKIEKKESNDLNIYSSFKYNEPNINVTKKFVNFNSDFSTHLECEADSMRFILNSNISHVSMYSTDFFSKDQLPTIIDSFDKEDNRVLSKIMLSNLDFFLHNLKQEKVNVDKINMSYFTNEKTLPLQKEFFYQVDTNIDHIKNSFTSIKDLTMNFGYVAKHSKQDVRKYILEKYNFIKDEQVFRLEYSPEEKMKKVDKEILRQVHQKDKGFPETLTYKQEVNEYATSVLVKQNKLLSLSHKNSFTETLTLEDKKKQLISHFQSFQNFREAKKRR